MAETIFLPEGMSPPQEKPPVQAQPPQIQTILDTLKQLSFSRSSEESGGNELGGAEGALTNQEAQEGQAELARQRQQYEIMLRQALTVISDLGKQINGLLQESQAVSGGRVQEYFESPEGEAAGMFLDVEIFLKKIDQVLVKYNNGHLNVDMVNEWNSEVDRLKKFIVQMHTEYWQNIPDERKSSIARKENSLLFTSNRADNLIYKEALSLVPFEVINNPELFMKAKLDVLRAYYKAYKNSTEDISLKTKLFLKLQQFSRLYREQVTPERIHDYQSRYAEENRQPAIYAEEFSDVNKIVDQFV